MIEQVLLHWKTSLSTFLPGRIKTGLVSVVKNYLNVIKNAVLTMRWFFVVDLCLMAILAEAVAKNVTSGAGFRFFVEITDINWFIIYSAIIILIRKREDQPDVKTYLKSMFFKYIRGLFIFMIFQMLFLTLLVICGITQFPTIHWVFKIVFQTFELLIIFYWLDSTSRFKDFLTSIEKAANLIFYNIPVFLIFLVLLLGLDYLLKFLACTGQNTDMLLLNNSSLKLLQSGALRFAELKLIFIKYSKLMFEIFWLCILFLFYDTNRNMFYSKSIFEHEENETD